MLTSSKQSTLKKFLKYTYVERVEAGSPDFGLEHSFILKNDLHQIRVRVDDLHPNPDIPQPFCSMAEWQFCSETYQDGDVDPMKPALRKLTLLMYYPVIPLFLGSLF